MREALTSGKRKQIPNQGKFVCLPEAVTFKYNTDITQEFLAVLATVELWLTIKTLTKFQESKNNVVFLDLCLEPLLKKISQTKLVLCLIKPIPVSLPLLYQGQGTKLREFDFIFFQSSYSMYSIPSAAFRLMVKGILLVPKSGFSFKSILFCNPEPGNCTAI